MSRPLLVLTVIVLVCGAWLVSTATRADGQGAGELNLVTLARIGGESNAVTADGSRVLLAEGESVLAVDASQPSDPRVTGRVGGFGGEISDMVIAGDVAYVASPVGVSVVDIANMAMPHVTTVLAVGEALAVGVEDARLYAVVAAGDRPWQPDGGRLHVFDVSDPSAPSEMGSVGDVTGWWGLAVADSVVWLPRGSNGLIAIDARDPSNMSEISLLDDVPGMRSPMCAGADRQRDRLYVAALEATGLNTKGLVAAFDTSDPAAPRLLGLKTRLDTSVADCVLRDGLFYIAQLDDGVEVHSTEGDGATRRRLQITTSLRATAVDAADGLTYVAENHRRFGVEPQPGQNPGMSIHDGLTQLGLVPTADYATGVALAGGVAYVASAASGLRAYDVSNPFEPRLLDAVTTEDGVAHRVAVDGDVALVADGGAGVRIFDVSNPSRIRLRSTHLTGGDTTRLAVRGGIGLAPAAPDQGVSVFEYSDPSAPRQVSRIDGSYIDVARDGELALLAGDREPLQYYDLTDPANPALVGELPSVYRRGNLALASADAGLALLLQRVPGWLFIPTPPPTPEGPPTAGPSPYPTPAATAPPDGSSLMLVDGSDPESPQVVSSILSPSMDDTVAYHRGRAYVGPSVSSVYDVSDPSEPRQLRPLIDGTPSALSMQDASGAGDLLYVAAGRQGLLILRPMDEDDPTPTATSTARGPGTLLPPEFTATAEAALTMTAGTPDVPINFQVYVPIAEAGE